MERSFFIEQAKRIRDIWFLGIYVYLCRKETNPEIAEFNSLRR